MEEYTVEAQEPSGSWHWVLCGASLDDALEHIKECEGSSYFLSFMLYKGNPRDWAKV